MASSVPAKQRRQAIWAAIKWWLSGSDEPVSQLRAIVASHDRINPIATPKDWSPAAAQGYSGDGRWWLLARPQNNWLSNRTNKVHLQTALACAWLRSAPSLEVRRWAVDLFEAHCPDSPILQDTTQSRLEWALRAALGWEPVPAGDIAPVDRVNMSQAERQWALRWAAMLGAEDMALQLGQDQGGLLVGADPKLMPLVGVLTLFNRPGLLGAALDEGANPNVALVHAKTPWFEQAESIASEWQGKLQALYDPPVDPSQKPAERRHALAIGWNGFNPSRWAATFNHDKCLQHLIDHGVRIDEFADGVDGAPVASALAEGNFTTTRQLIQSGAPVCPYRLQSEIKMGSRVVELLASFEQPVQEATNAQVSQRFVEIIEALPAALTREKVGETNQPWAACMYAAINENAPLVAGALVKAQGVNRWNLWTHTHAAAPGQTPLVQSFVEIALAKSAGKTNTVIEALASGGMSIVEPLSKECATPIGLFIAATVPTALKAWLNAATSAELVALLKSRGADTAPTALADAMTAKSDLWVAAIRGVDARVALSALLQNPIIAPTWTQACADVHGQGLIMAARGKPEALEAVVDLLPAPSWKKDAVIPQWIKALARPYDLKAIERTVAAWPVDVCVDKDGNTVLHLALVNKDPLLVQWVVQAGADPDRANNQGQTARAVADALGVEFTTAIANGEGGALQHATPTATKPSGQRQSRL